MEFVNSDRGRWFDELLAEIEERWKGGGGGLQRGSRLARSDLEKTTIRTSVFSPITPILAAVLDIRGVP